MMKTRKVMLSMILTAGTLTLSAQGAHAACGSIGGYSALAAAGQECSFSTDSDGAGGAIYMNPTFANIVGSGVIDPFLTVHAQGNNTYESGFSTDAPSNLLPLDTTRAGGTFTRTFQFSDLGFVTYNSAQYFQFFLDINEPSGGNQNTISLQRLTIYNTDQLAPILLDENDITNPNLSQLSTQSGWNQLYDLGNNILVLDYDIFGSGSGKYTDMSVLIPVAAFGGVDPTDRIVFATQFGSAYPSEDGFEEWYFRRAGTTNQCPEGAPGTYPICFPPQGIPEPATLALLGLGLAGIGAIRRLSARRHNVI